MKVLIRCQELLLKQVRQDLERPHKFAHERVGFLLAGAARFGPGLLLLGHSYIVLADEDYNFNPRVGAEIGRGAMKKALEAAYRTRSTLLHIHCHVGHGVPEFSETDIGSAKHFVPGFFNIVPDVPHGIIVLSEDDGAGLLWTGPKSVPIAIAGFTEIGRALRKTGSDHEAA